ncbi:hypothetical protein MOX01_05850 [Microbacterium oxydans]|nr:hypothetical protein MOX01_05850 [Microbacterium oxydans]
MDAEATASLIQTQVVPEASSEESSGEKAKPAVIGAASGSMSAQVMTVCAESAGSGRRESHRRLVVYR